MASGLPHLALAALLLLASGASSQEVGAVAPANRWYTHGGCAARSANATTAPVRGPVEIAWTHEVDGQLEGEPLVWDDRVLITFRDRSGRRVLRILDLLTGSRTLADRVFRSPVPLEPSMWGELVVLRSRQDEVQAFRFGSKRLWGAWSHRADGPVSAPLLLGTEVYVCTGTALERLEVGRRGPLWRAEGTYRGSVSLLGDHVFALQYRRADRAYLSRHRRSDGHGNEPMYAGKHGKLRPEPGTSSRIAVLDCGLFVRHVAPIVDIGPPWARSIGMTHGRWGQPTIHILGNSSNLLTEPAGWRSGWLGRIRDGEGEDLLTLTDYDSGDAVTLASSKANADFAGVDVPASIAGGVAYLGGKAFDVETTRVLWRLPIEASARAVPARETVLVPAGSRLVALRRRRGHRSEPFALGPAGSETVPGGALVLRDGSVETDELRWNGKRVEREGRRDGGAWDVEDALLLVDADRRVLFAAGTEELIFALERLARHRLAREYARLADDARRTNDLGLMRRLRARAWELGAQGPELDRVQRAIEILERRPKTIVRRRVEALAEEEGRLDGLPARLLWEHATALPTGSPPEWRIELTRAVLGRDPSHAGAVAAVRAMLPRGVDPGGGFDALDWLAFVEAVRLHPVRILRPAEAETDDMSYSERKLVEATVRWRKDLIGFQSEHLLIVTPLDRPGAIARCISAGELICGALVEIFGGSPERGRRDPMLLYLFSTRDEYLRESEGGSKETGSGLEWTAGHYDPQENLSRIFLPDRGEAFESVMQTYAHELTHHWLRMRCPRFPFEELEPSDLELPGFWIVEGFAGMVEEFGLDPRGGTWWSENPQSRRLDLVAGARADQRLSWDRLFGTSRRAFWSLHPEGQPRILSTCFLGRFYQVSNRHMFYAQSAATCRYLFHAENGSQREALLDFVAAYYTGDAEGVDVRKAFGLSPGELGERAAEYARREVGASAR